MVTTEDADPSSTYLEALALPPGEAKAAQKAALARAHVLRQFEIDNYWKRSTYFWGFQLAAFGALALAAKDGAVKPPLVLVVAAFGAITAFTGALTARGSKFWQQNWERHVDLLESQVEGSLMEIVFIKDKKPSFSVSRVNERLLEVLFALWISAFMAACAVLIWPSLLSLDPEVATKLQIGLTATALIAGLIWIGQKSSRSKIEDRLYDYHTLKKR
jgi:hypothetical protein